MVPKMFKPLKFRHGNVLFLIKRITHNIFIIFFEGKKVASRSGANNSTSNFWHRVVYGEESWSRVESDFGVAKVEWSAVVM